MEDANEVLFVPDAGRETTEPTNEPDLPEVPNRATPPGVAFFRQHMLDLHLMVSETMVVEEFERTVKSVAKAILPDRDERAAFPGLFAAVDHAKAANKHNWASRSEVALTRYVDNYLVYVAELIGALFVSRPESLRSKEQVSLEDLLKQPSLDAFVEWYADEKVNRLSYQGFGEVARFFQDRFGLGLVEEPDLKKKLVSAIATRNLLVHRRGVIDGRYVKALSDEGIDTSDLSVGQRLVRVEHFEAMCAVLSSVVDIEGRATAKFGLAVREIDPGEWWPGHAAHDAETRSKPGGDPLSGPGGNDDETS